MVFFVAVSPFKVSPSNLVDHRSIPIEVSLDKVSPVKISAVKISAVEVSLIEFSLLEVSPLSPFFLV